VGNGVAVPHPRNPSQGLFKNPHIIMARSIGGIDFQAPDNKKVHLFFMICAPNMVVHLRLLAKISKLLHIEGVIKKIIKASKGEDIIRLLLELERKKLFPWKESE
jgi:mannitol/fructose-specific phosphotransferase system IIA component (Ntr-type)